MNKHFGTNLHNWQVRIEDNGQQRFHTTDEIELLYYNRLGTNYDHEHLVNNIFYEVTHNFVVWSEMIYVHEDVIYKYPEYEGYLMPDLNNPTYYFAVFKDSINGFTCRRPSGLYYDIATMDIALDLEPIEHTQDIFTISISCRNSKYDDLVTSMLEFFTVSIGDETLVFRHINSIQRSYCHVVVTAEKIGTVDYT